MAKPPVLRHNATSGHLDYQTWILKVYIHCEGCKKKVFKVLQSIDGVYKTVIDSKQHKAIVSGSVDGNTLVQKLLRSGKHAEILPESFEATPAAGSDSENSKQKKKKKENNKQKDDVTKGNDNENLDEEKKEESEAATTDGNDAGNDQEVAQPPVAAGDGNGNGNGNDNDNGGGGGKNKKNKKKKGEKKDGDTPPNGETGGAPTGNAPAHTGVTAENVEASMEQLNLNPPVNQMVYATPYELPPYHNYYPTPVYGMSYNTSYPSTESSYYTPPVYGYAQSHPSVYYPPPPPPWYYPRSAFDDENQDGRLCTIM